MGLAQSIGLLAQRGGKGGGEGLAERRGGGSQQGASDLHEAYLLPGGVRRIGATCI